MGDAMGMRNGQPLRMMICITHIAMLRWHSFVPVLAVSSLMLMLLEHARVRRINELLESAMGNRPVQATRCQRSLSSYLCLVNVAFVAASLSILPERHSFPDMVLSALRECCMLVAMLIYMSMPLSEALGLERKKGDLHRLVAIFPAVLAMLVFPLVLHDATCRGGSLHCYLFGLCKVAMILSYQWFQSTFVDDRAQTDEQPIPSSRAAGWRSDRHRKVVKAVPKVLRFANTTSFKDDSHARREREAPPPAWLFGCIDCEFDLDEMDLV